MLSKSVPGTSASVLSKVVLAELPTLPEQAAVEGQDGGPRCRYVVCRGHRSGHRGTSEFLMATHSFRSSQSHHCEIAKSPGYEAAPSFVSRACGLAKRLLIKKLLKV